MILSSQGPTGNIGFSGEGIPNGKQGLLLSLHSRDQVWESWGHMECQRINRRHPYEWQTPYSLYYLPGLHPLGNFNYMINMLRNLMNKKRRFLYFFKKRIGV